METQPTKTEKTNGEWGSKKKKTKKENGIFELLIFVVVHTLWFLGFSSAAAGIMIMTRAVSTAAARGGIIIAKMHGRETRGQTSNIHPRPRRSLDWATKSYIANFADWKRKQRWERWRRRTRSGEPTMIEGDTDRGIFRLEFAIADEIL